MADTYDQLIDQQFPQNPATPVQNSVQQQKAGDNYDALIDQQIQGDRQQQAQRITSTVDFVSKQSNPDTAAKVQMLSRDMGLDEGLVERNLPDIERAKSIIDMDVPSIIEKSPTLSERLMDANFAAVAHDDTANLSGIEQTLRYGSNLGKSVLAGMYGFSEGMVGVAEAGAGAVSKYVTGPLADVALLPEDIGGHVESELAKIRRGQTYLRQKFTPQTNNDIEAGVYSGVQSLTQNLLMLPAAVMTANPEMALLPMAGVTGGQSYGKSRDMGLDPSMALSNAMLQAGIEYGTEIAPMGYLLKDLKMGSPFWKTAGHQLATEIPGEQMATLLQDMTDWAFHNPQKSAAEFLKERPSAAAQTLIATLVGTGGNVTILKGAEMVAQRDAQKAQKAEQSAQAMQQLTQLIQANKVVQRDPSTFERFVQSVSEEGPVDNVYVDANVLHQSGVGDQIAQLSPSVAEQYQQALMTGGQVAIPVAEYATRIAPTEYSAPLLDHLRTDPDGYSMQEAQQVLATHAEDMKVKVAQAILDVEENETFKASQDAVKADVLAQLNALNRFTPVVNELYATLHSSYAAVRAAQLGMTPEQFYKAHMLRIQAERVDGQQYDQNGDLKTNTPEFKAWFGDSKVVDKEGKPLVVYHGTGYDFSTFDMTHGGKVYGEKDSENVMYFSGGKARPWSASDDSALLNGGEPIPSPDGDPMGTVSGANIMPVYLSLKNPMVIDGYQATPEQIAKAKEAGHDGIIITEGESDDGAADYIAFHPEQIKSVFNRGTFDPNDPNILNQSGMIPQDEYRVLKREFDNLLPDEQEVFDAFINSRPDGQELLERLKQHKGTPWAFQATEGIFVRQAVAVYATGVTPSFQSMLDNKQVTKAREMIKNYGMEGLQMYLDASGFVGDAAKPINNVSSSFINCHPSDNCAKYCYATEGHYKYAPSVVKAELVSIAIEHDPIRAAKRTAAEYKATAEFANNKALRLFDKGDGNAAWLPYIKALNDDGVRVHVFSKVPDFLRQVPDKNLRLLSIDESNMAMADENQDLPVAFVYGGGQEQTDFLAKLAARGQIQVVLPIKLGRKIFDNAQTKQLKKDVPGIGKYLCPIDGGIKQIGKNHEADKWNCTKCDINGGLGCYFGKVTKTVMESAEVKPLSSQEKAKRILELRGLINEFNSGNAVNAGTGQALADTGRSQPGGVQQLLSEVDSLLGDLLRDYEPDAETRNALGGNGGTESQSGGVSEGQSNAGRKRFSITPVFEQSARGTFNPESNTITLLKNADLSTFLHEGAHYFFENDIAIASSLQDVANIHGIDFLSEGERQILDDVHTLMSWHGVQGSLNDQLNQWHTMPFEERRAYHEKTAESFERYLLEGKAPSIELQRPFQTFRAWMMNVYQNLKTFLLKNPAAGELSDEVRSVFDRMLATTDEIKLAEMGRSMMPLFSTAEEAGWTPEEFAAYHRQGLDATNEAIQELQAKSLRDLQWFQNARSRVLGKLRKQAKERRMEMRSEATTEIMSQPVYVAWAFLTRKLSDQDKLEPQKSLNDPEIVNPERDDLFSAIAKLGGLNKADVVATWGSDEAYKPQSGVFGKPVWRKEGGRSIDDMAEALGQYGYLKKDQHGKIDLREFEEKFDLALRGSPQYSFEYDYGADLHRPGSELRNPAALGAGRLDYSDLFEMGLTAEEILKLQGYRMVKKEGGLNADLVAGLTGFDSGDELLKALLSAPFPKAAIEALTDKKMLESYGELATPEAIELEADKAIHNDLRARVIATEMSALDKAVNATQAASPDKNGRQRTVPILPAAAKSFAGQMIARLKIRNIRPGQYASAEVRAAKLSGQARASGDLATAAAEKRNQLIQHYATKAAYDAKDEIESGLRYLKQFSKDSTRKRLDAEYADQIDALLERFELRPLSLKAIDKRKTLAQWLASQRDAGFEPEIPPDLEIEANRKSFRDMTVEEFRGLVDTVKQIEHLGRLKKKLLTAKDQREYEAVRDEIAFSINQNAGDRSANTRTPTTNLGRVAQSLKRFWASHIKAAMYARVMDGGKDAGPVWEYLVRPANERGDFETTMRAEATEKLSILLSPVFKLGKMGGSGIHFPSIDRSLNREARLTIALNMGNAGNIQRLLGGEGWSIEQLAPVLQSLTTVEWNTVQAIWDHLETYRPLIAEKEKRIYGKEPAWVEPAPFSIMSADGQIVDLRGGYYPIRYDPAASQRAEEHSDAEGAKRQLQGAYTSATTRRSFTKSRVENVNGRPLLYTLSGLYSGVNDVIHDLAWHEWLIDVNRFLKSQHIDDAIRSHYGPEAKAQFKTWVQDIAEGEKGADQAVDLALSRLRQGISAAGLGFNVMSALIQPLGITQSVTRVGCEWVGRGVMKYLAGPKDLTRQVIAKSDFMGNRMRTRFRELNELRNRVQDQSAFNEMTGRYAYFLMMRCQQMVDVPTWWGAYEKAIADGHEEHRAVSLADQAVIDSQGSGMTKDLAAIERGGPAQKIFTLYYSFMNTALNIGVQKSMNVDTPAKRGRLAVDYAMLYVVPAVLGYALKAALTPGDSGDDDPEKLARHLLANQIDYLMGLMVVVREFSEAVKTLTGANDMGRDYTGPAGLRAISDTMKFAGQASQGEFDDAFRKSAVNLVGDFFGLPSAQINRTWNGIEAISSGETSNPSAVILGYQKPH